MSNLTNYKSNSYYEEFDVIHQFGYKEYHLLRVMRKHETSFSEKQLEERENMLELGFAPAVMINKNFQDFLKVTRDF